MLSQQIIVAFCCSYFNIVNIVFNQSASQVVAVAMYSAFVEDNEIVGCFLEDHDTAPDPRLKKTLSTFSIIKKSDPITIYITN